MIPNISANGFSFLGAGAYHLNDAPTDANPRPRTNARLLFTETRNLSHTDPHRALIEMWRTAQDAPHIKTSPVGRKPQGPVKTISLSWKPDQTPSRGEMTAAANDFLASLGWAEHQAVYAAHGDKAHPHIHIILNRVHPVTGKILNDWQDRKRAQRWALAYERRTGPVLCPARLNKHAPRTSLPHPAAAQLKDRPEMRAQIRAELRHHWARYHLARKSRMIEQRLAERRHARVSASLAREGDFPRAFASLAANDDRRHAARQQLARQRQHISQLRQNLITRALAGPSPSAQRAERKSLLAQQSAGYAGLRSPIRDRAGELARAEIDVAFAHRWAEIERMPPDRRAAARAALAQEQEAAIATSTAQHAQRLAKDRHTAFRQLSDHYRQQRRALIGRHRLQWAQAKSAFMPQRPPTSAPTLLTKTTGFP